MASEQARATVLIVDDEPVMLKLVVDALEPAGFNVLIALQGAMALTLLDQVTPDVILLDAMMPGIDGFETCRRIKQRRNLALIPVIFMTGLTDTTNIVQGLQSGGVDYIVKPIVPGELIARIHVHLANAQLTQSTQRAMDVTGRYLLATSADGTLRWFTQQAGHLLGVTVAGKMLPQEVVSWLRQKLSDRRAGVPDTIGITLNAAAGAPPAAKQKRAEFSLVGELAKDEYLLRITELDEDRDLQRLQARMPLTRREGEVLLWLARGKSNRDIAQILNVSYRTIDKHLEQIYPKLGVEARTAAVAMAIRALENG
jgi:DNA-binding NarL/FixJ family response regulator